MTTSLRDCVTRCRTAILNDSKSSFFTNRNQKWLHICADPAFLPNRNVQKSISHITFISQINSVVSLKNVSVNIQVSVSVSVSVYVSVSLNLSVSLYVCLSLFVSVCLSVCLSLLSLSLSLSLSLHSLFDSLPPVSLPLLSYISPLSLLSLSPPPPPPLSLFTVLP